MEERYIDILRARTESTRSNACPREEIWARIGAGLVEGPEGEAAVEHAAECDYCGPLLRMACEDLDFDLESGQEAPPQASPPRVAQFPKPKPKTPRWWMGAVAAALILAAVLTGVRLLNPRQSEAERLVAAAFTQNRTLDLRLPDVPYAPRASTEKGIGESAHRGAAAAAAEAAVLQQLERDPQNPKWIALKSRVELLRYRYDNAVQSVRPWADRGDVPPNEARDVGIAYLARGLARNSDPSDFEQAVEWLSRALEKNSKDPVALFNRAEAEQQLLLWGRAEEDWKAYLAIDNSSGWANEARAQLTKIQEKKSTGEPR